MAVKNLPASTGDLKEMGLIPGWGRSLGEERTTHSSILAWEIPWTGEPEGIQCMVLQRVGHDGSDLAHTQILYLYKIYVNIYVYIYIK